MNLPEWGFHAEGERAADELGATQVVYMYRLYNSLYTVVYMVGKTRANRIIFPTETDDGICSSGARCKTGGAHGGEDLDIRHIESSLLPRQRTTGCVCQIVCLPTAVTQ